MGSLSMFMNGRVLEEKHRTVKRLAAWRGAGQHHFYCAATGATSKLTRLEIHDIPMTEPERSPDPAASVAKGVAAVPEQPKEKTGKAREIGGPKGPEPTRYGDWEKKGRCIDF
jgi:hypothetical protein